jgi:hypothetical protein
MPRPGFPNKVQIQLEKREDSRRRGLASPDLAGTPAMTFAEQIHSCTEGEWVTASCAIAIATIRRTPGSGDVRGYVLKL